MNILIPNTITDSMLTSCTVAEPAAGETVWTGGSYAIGARVIRPSIHRIFECVADVSGATPPESDATHWLDAGPTARWAALDQYVSTQTTATGSLSFVLRPGFFDSIALYGLTGVSLHVTLKDAPGGTVVYDSGSVLLEEDPLDWWDWAFGQSKPLTKWFVKDLALYADPELTVTVTAATGEAVGIGMLVLGTLTPMVNDSTWGGTEQGAAAAPQTFSYIKVDDYGNVSIKRRRAATDLQFKVVMPRDQADYALALVQRVLDVPCAWIATDAAGYAGLNTFGLGSGSMSYDSFGIATFSGSVKGMI